MDRRDVLKGLGLTSSIALAGCSERVERLESAAKEAAQTEAAARSSPQTSNPTASTTTTRTATTPTLNRIERDPTKGGIFQTATVTDTPDTIRAGQSISVTGKVKAQTASAQGNIVYAAVGTPSGDLYGLKRMSGTGSGTVTVPADVPSDAAGKTLIWTFVPATSESAARKQFRAEANKGRYQPEELAIPLGTITPAQTTTRTPTPNRIERDPTKGGIFQTGVVADAPNEIQAGETISITGKITAQKSNARSNIVYGAVGTPSGDLYGLKRMSSTGSGTVTVSAEIPSDATGKTLIWTFVPATSESAARDQFHEEASNGRYQPGKLAIHLGTITEAQTTDTTPDRIERDPTKGGIFQTGVVTDAPTEIRAGQTVSITGEVTAQTTDAQDNIVYAAAGTPTGDLYGLTRMSSSGSGTVTVSGNIPSDAAGQTLIWTFIPATSENAARTQFHEEANNGRYQSGNMAIPLGTITEQQMDTSTTDRIERDPTKGSIFQTGVVTDAPSEFHAGETISVTGEITAETESAESNVVYGAVGTPTGDLYGLKQMSSFGSGTVTVSASIPSDAAGKSLIWTFIPATSESAARSQFQDEASNGRYEPGELAIPLGTITEAQTTTPSSNTAEITRETSDGQVFQSGTVTDAPDTARAGQSVSVTGEITAEISDAQDNIVYGAVGTPSGDLYGLKRMSGSGSGSVTVSADIPSDAAGKTLIWTFIPSTSESAARSQYQDEASKGRYQPGDLAISLGTIQ